MLELRKEKCSSRHGRKHRESCGLDTIFKKDHPRIFLKVNLLSAAKPEEAVTTHPEVVYALAKILKENGRVLLSVTVLEQGRPIGKFT
jgi:uncharacterized protein (DUF362 family)